MNANSQLSLEDDTSLTLRRGRLSYCEGESSQWHELCERNLGHVAVRPGHAGLPDDLVRSAAVVPSQDPS